MLTLQNKKRISEFSFGKILKQKRIDKGLSLEKAEIALNISKKYLVALEENDYASLPGKVYAKNFVKKYLRFLELKDDYLNNWEEEYSFFQEISQIKIPAKKFKQIKIKKKITKWGEIFITPKFFKNIATLFVFLFSFVYLGVEAKEVFGPPQIDILSPVNNLIFNEYTLKVEGKAEKGAKIFINNKSILTDNEGRFEEKIILKPGVNIIKISAKKKNIVAPMLFIEKCW